VLIDSKLEQHADALRRAIESLGPGTVRYVINTHHHPENCGGNRAFPEASVLAQENTARRLRAAGRSGATVGFRTRATLNLSHETIELSDAGPAHTDGDSVVYLTEAKVLVLGGLVADRIHPAILPEHGADPRSWLRSLRSIRARFADGGVLFVPGDGPAGDIDLIDRQIGYLQDLVDLMESAHRHGLSLREALDTAQPLRERYAAYRGDHFERNLEATYRITGS